MTSPEGSPSRVYVDTSAVGKLFLAERESADLRTWFERRPGLTTLVASALLAVELLRLLGLAAPGLVGDAERFLADDVDIVEITPTVLSDAARVGPSRLRTLDAIHLATALDLGPSVDTFVTYDKLLGQAAAEAGFAVAAPGAGW